MDSPPESVAGDMPQGRPTVTFRFCRNCSNLLHPSEDKEAQQLRYKCRTCHYSELSDNPCIHSKSYEQDVTMTAGSTQDVQEDPALQRTERECPQCHERQVVFFQSQQRHKDTGMQLFYVCVACQKDWRGDKVPHDGAGNIASRFPTPEPESDNEEEIKKAAKKEMEAKKAKEAAQQKQR